MRSTQPEIIWSAVPHQADLDEVGGYFADRPSDLFGHCGGLPLLPDELRAHTDQHSKASRRQMRFIKVSILASREWMPALSSGYVSKISPRLRNGFVSVGTATLPVQACGHVSVAETFLWQAWCWPAVTPSFQSRIWQLPFLVFTMRNTLCGC